MRQRRAGKIGFVLYCVIQLLYDDDDDEYVAGVIYYESGYICRCIELHIMSKRYRG